MQNFIRTLVLFLTAAATVCASQGLEIKKDGRANCEIVVPENSCPVAEFAGKELQAVLSESLGTEINIVKTPDPSRISIILGENQYSKNAGIDVSKLPRDGFIIKTSGNDMFIAGRDDAKGSPEKQLKGGIWGMLYERGTLFGVYEFLEKFAGTRFYFPGKIGTVIPKHSSLNIPEIDFIGKPDYTVRYFSSFDGETPDGANGPDSHPFKNMNYYRLRMQTRYIPNCHGLSRLGYVKRFSESHPEYFAQMADGQRYNKPEMQHTGQLCLSSGIKDEIYKDAEAYLTGKSAASRGVTTIYGVLWDNSGFQPGYFNVMPQDGFYKCQCPECKKHWVSDQAASEFIWGVVCDIAEKLKKNNIPGYITMMAYPPYRLVPERKIPDNVLVMLAESGPWYMNNKDTYEREEKEIKAWVEKMGGKIWIWTYPNKYGNREMPGVPALTPKCIGEYYKRQKPYIFGAYMESETDKYIFNYLNYYIFSRVIWNNDSDVNAILKEHYNLMFGKAANKMQDIYNIFEEKWLKIIGKNVDTPLGPASVPVSEYELWEKVYSEKEIAKLDKLFDEAEKLVSGDTDSLDRVEFMRKNLLGTIKQQRAKYVAVKNEIEDLRFHANETYDPINIDGVADEKDWEKCEKLYLIPYGKNESDIKNVRTIVKALKDDKNLYFFFECEEPEMSKILSSSRETDDRDIWRDSSVEIFLNPSGDRKKYYHIIVNASGSIADIAGTKEGASQNLDWEWMSGVRVVVQRGEKSWTAEIAIPLASLPDIRQDGFPANFNRSRATPEAQELFTWSPFLRNGFHDIEHFGNLVLSSGKEANIIRNGDFTGKCEGRFFNGWYAQPAEKIEKGTSWSFDESTFMKGGKSLKLSSEGGSISILQYLPELRPNTKYQLSFFLKTENVVLKKRDWAGVCVNIWDDKNRWFPANFYTGTIPWSKQGFTFETGPGSNIKTKSYIRLCVLNASGTAWFDDLKLVEVFD